MTKRILPQDDQEGTSDLFNSAPPPVADAPAPDPFDPARLRLSQDFASSLGVKKVLTTVRCRKPTRQEFVRTRPGEDWRLETGVFEDKVLRETYLVDPSLWTDMAGEIHHVCLFLTITRQNDIFLWPVKLPGQDGRPNSWLDSALAAAQLAERRWIRMAANMANGLYDVFEASGELADPEWPPLSLHEILRLAFKAQFITSADHPILKQLRGES